MAADHVQLGQDNMMIIIRGMINLGRQWLEALACAVALTASARLESLVLRNDTWMGTGGSVKEGCLKPARLQQISM